MRTYLLATAPDTVPASDRLRSGELDNAILGDIPAYFHSAADRSAGAIRLRPNRRRLRYRPIRRFRRLLLRLNLPIRRSRYRRRCPRPPSRLLSQRLLRRPRIRRYRRRRLRPNLPIRRNRLPFPRPLARRNLPLRPSPPIPPNLPLLPFPLIRRNLPPLPRPPIRPNLPLRPSPSPTPLFARLNDDRQRLGLRPFIAAVEDDGLVSSPSEESS